MVTTDAGITIFLIAVFLNALLPTVSRFVGRSTVSSLVKPLNIPSETEVREVSDKSTYTSSVQPSKASSPSEFTVPGRTSLVSAVFLNAPSPIEPRLVILERSTSKALQPSNAPSSMFVSKAKLNANADNSFAPLKAYLPTEPTDSAVNLWSAEQPSNACAPTLFKA